MKAKHFFLVFFMLSNTVSYAQKILTIDIDSIRNVISNSSSEQYYPLLLERMNSFDTTLTENDYKCLYYGYTTQPGYNPYNTSSERDTFLSLLNDKKYKEAIPVGLKILEEQPFNLKAMYWLLVCHKILGDKFKASQYAHNYFWLLFEIGKSGDGKSTETAFVVIDPSDEYSILDNFGLRSTGQTLLIGAEGHTDKLSIDTTNQTNISKLYFNVTLPFSHLQKKNWE